MPSLTVVDQPVAPAEAEAVLALARGFRGYRPSSYRPPPQRSPTSGPPRPAPATQRPELRERNFGPRFGGRLDAARNFIRTGGRLGRADEDPALLAARTNYFRGAYAVNGQPTSPAAELLLRHGRLRELARAVHGRDVVVPFVVYANLLIPGQELGVHTDVPAFRGVAAGAVPPWLLVVMAHSRLFEERRVPITTVVLYFGQARGGEFAYYPDGPEGEARLFDPSHNSAVALDADVVFHGVDRVQGSEEGLRRLAADMQLVHEGSDWHLRAGQKTVSRYGSGEVRFSVSWKAYCFTDADEQTRFTRAPHDLSSGQIIRTLEEELQRRGRLRAAEPDVSNGELAHLLVDEFVRFPAVTAGAEPPSPSLRTAPDPEAGG